MVATASRSVLAAPLSGKASDEEDAPRVGIGRTVLEREIAHLLLADRRALAADHHRHRHLALDGVGDRHDRDVDDVGVGQKQAFDLEWIDVLAAGN